ncbi:hypothetical protein B296_00048587 [Ensete ventricosum]|uniref:Uncharacterized protein n=1 Tax=Ensete ventricosum TaxID=4639 RepID=A0A426Y9E9_ENSVE|nr:hypothetical protein B296_00048587 [Ensete ventricosum]
MMSHRTILRSALGTTKEDTEQARATPTAVAPSLTQLNSDKYLPPDPGKGTPRGTKSDEDLWEEHDWSTYYRFHHDYSHNTKECYNLKNQIEDLIHRGHLDRHVRKLHEMSHHPKGLVKK